MVTQKRRQHDAVFRAIADPTRREILRVLRGVGLIQTHREGTARICTLNAKPLRAVDEWLRDYAAFWDENLRSLKTFTEEKS